MFSDQFVVLKHKHKDKWKVVADQNSKVEPEYFDNLEDAVESAIERTLESKAKADRDHLEKMLWQMAYNPSKHTEF